MKVFRVQHTSLVSPYGHPAGPYADNAWLDAEHADSPDNDNCDECAHTFISAFGVSSRKRPMPCDDGLGRCFDEDNLFCFQSPYQLWDWFSRDLSELARLGYVMAVYKVPDSHTRHGSYQSVFNWKFAEWVEEVDLREALHYKP